MKNCCVICGKPLEEYEIDLCETCFRFFHQQYDRKFKRKIAQFKKSNRVLENWKEHLDIDKKEVEE